MHTIAYLAPEYGALTSTFVYREVAALRSLGFRVVTFSTLRPQDAVISDEARPEVAETTYLYDLPKVQVLAEATSAAAANPARFMLWEGRAMYDCLDAKVSQWQDRPKIFWHFLMGCALAHRLRAAGVEHLHAHFAHVPTAIAMYAAAVAGIPYSFTCHANDIFQRAVALKEKVGRAAFVSSISDFNIQYLTERGCDPSRMEIVRCGIDVDAYTYQEPTPPQGPLRIFSVGRLVEKKGMCYLIDAVAELRKRGHDVRCRIAGNGPLRDELDAQIARLNVGDAIEMLGSQPQERIRELLREADVFVLACVVAASNDMDGIPVSLMEAMAMGIPVVSTPVSGIPELIHDGENGYMATPNDAGSLAGVLERIATRFDEAAGYTHAARERVANEFEQMLNAKRLKEHMETAIAEGRRP